MRAIGKDGHFHEWAELTAEEQREWQQAMAVANKVVEQRKSVTVYPVTLADSLLDFEWRRYGMN